jgi:ATP-binding cassette subfamily B protein
MHKSLKPLYPYLWKYRKTLAIGAISVVLTNVIWVLFPQVLQRATDALNSHATRRQLAVYCLLMLAIAFSKGIFQFLTRWLVIGVSREIEYDLRNDLFRHLEGLSYSYYQKTRTGDVMARATNDLNAVRMLLGPAIMYSANTLVYTIAALAFMWRTSHRLTLLVFIPLPLSSILIQYFGRKIHERFERIQAQFSDISARAQENFSGARVIRAYAQPQPAAGPPDGYVMAEFGDYAGSGDGDGGVARGQGSSVASHQPGTVRGLLCIHAAAYVAHYRPGLGDQYLSARYGFHGPNQ